MEGEFIALDFVRIIMQALTLTGTFAATASAQHEFNSCNTILGFLVCIQAFMVRRMKSYVDQIGLLSTKTSHLQSFFTPYKIIMNAKQLFIHLLYAGSCKQKVSNMLNQINFGLFFPNVKIQFF